MKPIVSRSEWGAVSPRHFTKGNLSKPTTLHWNGNTVTVKGKTEWPHSDCKHIVRGVQSFHMAPVSQGGRGWSDGAYNFVECPHGYLFEMRGINTWNGANGTNEGNRTSHALMVLAGEGNPFSEAEKIGIIEGRDYIALKSAAPAELIGHRDHKSTECPGNTRYAWLKAGAELPAIPAPEPPALNQGEITMEAAILLLKHYYDVHRGDGKGGYDVSVRERSAYFTWLEELLKAQSAGTSLFAVVDYVNYALKEEKKK